MIQKIFKKKKQEESEDRDNLLRLSSQRLYGEKIHYVLELIQNAEDEESHSVLFLFNKDSLSVINDGRPFNSEDVWAICSVNPGRKKNKIGFFGIGFKSVFNITKKPRIISNVYNFEIKDYLYPKIKKSFPPNLKKYYSAEKGTICILPYYSCLATPGELIENFNSLDDKILLFLKNLSELKIIDNINKFEWQLKKEIQENSTVVLLDTRNNEETKWRVFHRTIKVENQKIVPEGKEGIKRTKITIAFPMDVNIKNKIRNSGVVYCYLPTRLRTDLGFLIQGDFLPAIGRENIQEHPWNIWLMEELGKLAADAINKLKKDELLGEFIYDFIPLSNEIQNELVKYLYKKLCENIKKKSIAKTKKGWLRPENCLIPDDDQIRDVITENDLKSLFPEKVSYVDENLSKKGSFTRAENVIFELGGKKISSSKVIEFLQLENELKKKNERWFLCLYDYLQTIFDTSRKSYSEDFPWEWDESIITLYKKMEKTKFLLTDENELVQLNDSPFPNRLICYAQNIDLSEVHQFLTEGELVFLNRYFQESGIVHRKTIDNEIEEKRKRVKDWFDNIGVKKYFKQSHIIRYVILPKFSNGKYKNYDDLTLYKLIDYIRTYWSTVESEIKNKKLSPEIINEIKRHIKLKTFSYKKSKKIFQYRNPDDIYFSKRYKKNAVMRDLFKGIRGISFLSPYYLNREKYQKRKGKLTWLKFFENIGVWNSPRIVKDKNWSNITGKEEYYWVKKQYSSQGIHEVSGDVFSEDIEKVLGYCTKINNKKEILKRMNLLWDSLEKNWKIYKERDGCKSRYRWLDYSYKYQDYETTSFLELLHNASWVHAKDGGFYKPNEVFIDTEKNQLLLGDNVKYTKLSGNETFLRDLGVRIEPELKEVVEHLKTYREANPFPKENKTKKMATIYTFLNNKINSLEDSEDSKNKINKIKEVFNKSELLYLPREDKSWWKPSHVFWRDFSDTFRDMRGYIEHEDIPLYSSKLMDFLKSLGVIEKPLVKDCFDILQELKISKDLDKCKNNIPLIYNYLNDLIEKGLFKDVKWNRAIFLSENGKFLHPTELYYNDNDEYGDLFKKEIEILWLPFSWLNIRYLIQTLPLRSLNQSVSVEKKIGKLYEIEGDKTNYIIQILSCGGNYLKKKNVKLYEQCHREGTFQRIRQLQAYKTQKIALIYLLQHNNKKQIIFKDIVKDCYFSPDESRIYLSNNINLLSTTVAKELSRLFFPAGEEVFPILDSLFGASVEVELDKKLKYFGIKLIEPLEREDTKVIRIIPGEAEDERKFRTETEHEEKQPQLPDDSFKKPSLPQISQPDYKSSDLVDIDNLTIDTIEDYIPLTKFDGKPIKPIRKVKLKKGKKGIKITTGDGERKGGRIDAEPTALELVEIDESSEGWKTEDRHLQRLIGYDIYCYKNSKKEKFIEVKHFRGAAGEWELTPTQWKKAKKEGDKYFVYVVSKLSAGNNPIIEIIQNPERYLTPDPPSKKIFSNWKNGVIKVIKHKKI